MNTFPVICDCPARRGKCARNMLDCDLPWVVDWRERDQPNLIERIVGFFAALFWWR